MSDRGYPCLPRFVGIPCCVVCGRAGSFFLRETNCGSAFPGALVHLRGVRLHLRGVRFHLRGVRFHLRGVRFHLRELASLCGESFTVSFFPFRIIKTNLK